MPALGALYREPSCCSFLLFLERLSRLATDGNEGLKSAVGSHWQPNHTLTAAADILLPSKEDDILSPGTVVHERWYLLERIGAGGFGQIFVAKDLKSANGTTANVAIKLEVYDKARVRST